MTGENRSPNSKRRRFGKIRKTPRSGLVYYEASYPTPPEAFEKWPWLHKRQYKTVTPERRGDLDAWLRDAERLIRLDAWEPPNLKEARRTSETIKFTDYAAKWVETRQHPDGTPIEETTKQKHRENIRLYLDPAFGRKPVSEISYRMIKDWYDDFIPVRRNVSLANRRGAVYRTLKAILNSAATEPIDDEGHTLIKESPALIPAPKARPKHEALIPSDAQLLAIYEEMPDWLRLSVLLAGKVGLREGEILALKVKRIDMEHHVIHVREAAKEIASQTGMRMRILGKPKTQSSVRDAEYPSFLDTYILKHISEFTDGKPESLLFTAPVAGGIVGGQTVRSSLSKAVARATPELVGMRFHDLRDTGLTAFMAAGGTLGETMGQGGHTSMKIASRYQKHLKSHTEQVMDQMNRMHEQETNKTSTPQAEAEEPPEVNALTSLLTAMQPEAIAAALTKMDEEQKKQVLAALPPETVQQVLLATLSE